MDVNESIVTILKRIGVRHVFGGSGQVNGSMLIALKKNQDAIKTVIIRNEQAASFMACGYAMFNDNLGVCFATGGPGAFNLFSGLAVAYSDSLPVLAISGYTSASQRGKGALNESTGLSRTPDSLKMFAATTKKSYIIESPEQTCDLVEDALATAFSGRPGPVHIHVPKDMTVAQVPNFRDVSITVRPVLPEQHQLDAFCSALRTAIAEKRRIAVLVGYGVLRSHAERETLAFIERFGLPAMSTMDAKGAIAEDHPLYLGVYGSSGDAGANRWFEQAEVIVALGNSFAQNATFSFKPDLYAGKQLFHVNIDPHEIDKVYKADYCLVSDARSALGAIASRLSESFEQLPWPQLPKQTWHDTPIQKSSEKIHPGEMVKVLSANLPADAIVLGDAGSHMLWLNCYLHLTKNQRYQNPGSFGPMASHVNGAIGVKCANPEKTVVCGCGDGAYLMAGFELLTAVENKIPLIWVIFNNGEFNVIKKLLINNFGEHAFMQFRNPDYVAYAHACGASAFHVDKIEEFEPAFQKALHLNAPVLIDVAVDADVYPPFVLGKV